MEKTDRPKETKPTPDKPKEILIRLDFEKGTLLGVSKKFESGDTEECQKEPLNGDPELVTTINLEYRQNENKCEPGGAKRCCRWVGSYCVYNCP